MSLDPNEAPKGFIAVSRKEFNFEKIGNICNACDARSLCQENKNDWCLKNRCSAFEVIDITTGKLHSRKDGNNVVFIKKGM